MWEGESSPNLSGTGTRVSLCSTGVELSPRATARAVCKLKEWKRALFGILLELSGRARTDSCDFSAWKEVVKHWVRYFSSCG